MPDISKTDAFEYFATVRHGRWQGTTTMWNFRADNTYDALKMVADLVDEIGAEQDSEGFTVVKLVSVDMKTTQFHRVRLNPEKRFAEFRSTDATSI